MLHASRLPKRKKSLEQAALRGNCTPQLRASSSQPRRPIEPNRVAEGQRLSLNQQSMFFSTPEPNLLETLNGRLCCRRCFFLPPKMAPGSLEALKQEIRRVPLPGVSRSEDGNPTVLVIKKKSQEISSRFELEGRTLTMISMHPARPSKDAL